MAGDLKADGGIANRDAVFDAEVSTKTVFQLFDDLAVVGKPATFENAFEVLHEDGVIAKVGTSDEKHGLGGKLKVES